MPSAIIRGYHGTTLSAAQSIISDKRFRSSSGDYHWLGPGIYFWQDAPLRAWAWALYKQTTTGDEPAVVSAAISTTNILDLTDIGNEGLLRDAYRSIQEECDAADGWLDPNSRPLPTQHAPIFFDADGIRYPIGSAGEGKPKYNWLDHAVIERATHAIWHNLGVRTKSVRCAFSEGQMLYPNSYIFDRAHVQIAVRELDVISDIKLEDSIALKLEYDAKITGWNHA